MTTKKNPVKFKRNRGAAFNSREIIRFEIYVRWEFSQWKINMMNGKKVQAYQKQYATIRYTTAEY